MEKLRVIFMGTPDFAVPCLEKLSEIAAIIYASLLKKWSLMKVKLNLSINLNRQKTRPKTEKNSDKEVQE